MGLTYIDGVVSGPSGVTRTVRFLVDSGAKYSLLPLDDRRALGLTAMRQASLSYGRTAGVSSVMPRARHIR